jgi:hypothetical protein
MVHSSPRPGAIHRAPRQLLSISLWDNLYPFCLYLHEYQRHSFKWTCTGLKRSALKKKVLCPTVPRFVTNSERSQLWHSFLIGVGTSWHKCLNGRAGHFPRNTSSHSWVKCCSPAWDQRSNASPSPGITPLGTPRPCDYAFSPPPMYGPFFSKRHSGHWGSTELGEQPWIIGETPFRPSDLGSQKRML